MKHWVFVISLLLLTSCGVSPASHVAQGQSAEFTVDKHYPSMSGPLDRSHVNISPSNEPVWVRGITIRSIGPSGTEKQEHLCHTNAYMGKSPSYNPSSHAPKGGNTLNRITLATGKEDILFPEGFGMKFESDNGLMMETMLLNNEHTTEPFTVHFEYEVNYSTEDELDTPLKELTDLRLALSVPVHEHEAHSHIPDDSSHSAARADDGTYYSYHWMVMPGKHTYTQLFEQGLNIPSQATLHYITAHLHQYGQSLELFDKTENTSIFIAHATPYDDSPTIETVTHYSSVEGLQIDPDHEFEIRAVYDNTADGPIDAMAILYLYYHDPNGYI